MEPRSTSPSGVSIGADAEPITTARLGTSCPECAFDLRGQRVFRETHYNLNVIVCPECGGVSPYGPRIRGARAERRRGSLIVFLWLTCVFALLLGMGASMMGLAQSTGFAASVPMAADLSLAFDSSSLGRADDRVSIWEFVSVDWWEEAADEFLRSRGGVAELTDWIVLTDLLYMPLIAIPFAMLWRVLFMHSRRIVQTALLATSFALGAFALGAYQYIQTLEFLGEFRRAIAIAEGVVGRPVAWLSYLVCSLVMLAAISFADPVLRILTAHVAPPSIRAKLWKFDRAASG